MLWCADFVEEPEGRTEAIKPCGRNTRLLDASHLLLPVNIKTGKGQPEKILKLGLNNEYVQCNAFDSSLKD
jgi:hypothetical protein